VASSTFEHLMTPDDSASHIHCCAYKLDPTNAVDLDRFARIILSSRITC
jgi:hypothetical protein